MSISGELVTLILGLAGVAATIYGTRSSRMASREATADTTAGEMLKAAVEVNSMTYKTLSEQQTATIARLEQQLGALSEQNAGLNMKIDALQQQISEQQETIESLRSELEGQGHGPIPG